MNKRDRMLSLLDDSPMPGYVPAAFFLHFPQECHRGQTAVDKHLEYFRYTGMDFVKIQYEFPFPHLPQIQTPNDWAKMPSYRQEYFQDQLNVVAGLVKAAKSEALILCTLYSPFMSAAHTVGSDLFVQHLQTDPEKVKKGMEIVTDSLMWFVRECIKLGVDGFYASTQGGERDRFDDPKLFVNYVKPYDLIIMEEMNRVCEFNILHVCDYWGPYDDFSPFPDYPGHVVNIPLEVGGQTVTGQKMAAMFARPFMGGLDRHGVIVNGSEEEIRTAVAELLEAASHPFILGADCTLPGDIDWANIKTVIDTAHDWK